ncbi:hypothetical protein [Ensifer sp. NM-2]|uniref:hypothetical protein n=1 Tax=Ensifer sp. NM-2 TaxID=2109730 RepID=UPI0018EC4126|nr:hypothetical protein [Ensifer sp. NM-2]
MSKSTGTLGANSFAQTYDHTLEQVVLQIFGADAALVAARCALAAKFAGRDEDCRRWAVAFRRLRLRST